MRHQKQRHKLSRDSAHRKALLMNLSKEVIQHERIKTTEAKAKAAKPEIERLITLAKRGDQHARRQAAAALGQDKFIVYRLFEEIGPRYAERPGGYTRILKLGPRRSDASEMVFLELVRPPGYFSNTTGPAMAGGRGSRISRPSRVSSRPRWPRSTSAPSS
jgi:large subunit ribosomal protein L17